MTAAVNTAFQTGISGVLFILQSRKYRRNCITKGSLHHSHTDRVRIQDRVLIDPARGSGSLLINIGQSAAKRIGSRGNIKYYA